jgi:hypothetical protein
LRNHRTAIKQIATNRASDGSDRVVEVSDILTNKKGDIETVQGLSERREEGVGEREVGNWCPLATRQAEVDESGEMNLVSVELRCLWIRAKVLSCENSAEEQQT